MELKWLGFHARAQQIVDSFVSRVQASPTKLDLETTDLELSRALACLRDECIGKLEDLRAEKSGGVYSSPNSACTEGFSRCCPSSWDLPKFVVRKRRGAAAENPPPLEPQPGLWPGLGPRMALAKVD